MRRERRADLQYGHPNPASPLLFTNTSFDSSHAAQGAAKSASGGRRHHQRRPASVRFPRPHAAPKYGAGQPHRRWSGSHVPPLAQGGSQSAREQSWLKYGLWQAQRPVEASQRPRPLADGGCERSAAVVGGRGRDTSGQDKAAAGRGGKRKGNERAGHPRRARERERGLGRTSSRPARACTRSPPRRLPNQSLRPPRVSATEGTAAAGVHRGKAARSW